MMPVTKPSFIILDSVDSTNNYAMAKVHAGLAKHGDAYFSFNQTGGKGQRGKKWHTGNGENIAVSIITDASELHIHEQFKLSAAIALACVDFFGSFAGDETTIKWPNDIYWRDRKAGGILIENVIGHGLTSKKNETSTRSGAYWKYSVAGIGININQDIFENDLNKAISLKQITGQDFDITVLAQQLHLAVLDSFKQLLTQPFEKILQRYNERLFKRNQAVQLKKGNIVFSTTIKEVTESGQLFTVDLIDNLFGFGEVEWLL
ncbi:biotin--[acetyl-CoA-carboxylase] ligase [Ferruginibacter paludis]|uniref:biotin--[acetyl-CoA-carboxylase] ligase n=1 Tax=Ferruginibacter paludis TaxID=1310417 RepID=UPI0025B61672|nr:biotin--[acetyl-CoA-carboxylase] ligase [Ferruginibacter paludis]MDN3658278.1 biotin--[acetyl-CoA-carboxylase] ligase [Ferruginibacter paludis]